MLLRDHSETDPDISIREGGGVGVFLRKAIRISKPFVLRKSKRFRGVIQSENYKTWIKEK